MVYPKQVPRIHLESRKVFWSKGFKGKYGIYIISSEYPLEQQPSILGWRSSETDLASMTLTGLSQENVWLTAMKPMSSDTRY